MHVRPTELPEVLILEPAVFEDARGWFMESWSERAFREAVGSPVTFVQDNHSSSAKWVLRGIHYQVEPAGQGKLVRVARGRVWDVAVDLRRSSSSFTRWVGVELSAANRRQLWIPNGFGHGFLALEDETDVLYKTTAYYDGGAERAIRWDDPDLGIDWGVDNPALSDRDARASNLADAELFA